MSVWLAIPSKRPVEEANKILEQWRAQGYLIALWLDKGDDHTGRICDRALSGESYPGYAQACNALIKMVLQKDPECRWIVTGGDDIQPDLAHTAEEIADQCGKYFFGYDDEGCIAPGTYGVCQPVGDRWGEQHRHMGAMGSAYIDRVAGSPWLGRAFCERMYQGNGPYWPEYVHQFVDAELMDVAQLMGVFWQRRDLVHLHQHWGRSGGFKEHMPAFLAEANTQQHWDKYKAIYESRKKSGFPGHAPL